MRRRTKGIATSPARGQAARFYYETQARLIELHRLEIETEQRQTALKARYRRCPRLDEIDAVPLDYWTPGKRRQRR